MFRFLIIICFISIFSVNSSNINQSDNFIYNMYFYPVKSNDNLTLISEEYGKGNLGWKELWSNNEYILDPNLIYPGQLINLNSNAASKVAIGSLSVDLLMSSVLNAVKIAGEYKFHTNNKYTLLFDAASEVDTAKNIESSIGARSRTYSDYDLFEAYVAYNVKHTVYKKTYHAFNAGLEYTQHMLFVNIHMSCPISEKKVFPVAPVDVYSQRWINPIMNYNSSTNIMTEIPAKGINFEIGSFVKKYTNIEYAIGYYYYFASDIDGINGVYSRVGVILRKWMSVNLSFSYDRIKEHDISIVCKLKHVF